MSHDDPVWCSAEPPFGINLLDELPVDPYLVWAALTGFPKDRRPRKQPFLLELGRPGDCIEEKVKKVLKEGGAELLAWVPGSRYQTLWLSVDFVRILVKLLKKRLLTRFQLGAARGTPQPGLPAQDPPPQNKPPQLQTLGVIDDGCCLAHASFRTADNASRFAFVWDQDPRAESTSIWKRYEDGKCPRPTYGVELLAKEIETKLKEHPDLGEAAERKFYEAIERPNWGAPDRTHGTRVLHLLATERLLCPPPQSAPFDKKDVTKMPIIFVQLPEETVEDTSGGSLGFYVLDGARYIVNRARRLADACCDSESVSASRWETTINISLGSIAGPHDGTTITEKALDELIQKHKHKGNEVRIVLAAGNTAGGAFHAVRDAGASSPEPFQIMVQPDNFRESFVEFWLPPPPEGGIWKDASCSFEVTTPDGATCSLQRGDIKVLKRGRQIVASAIFARAVAQGINGTMVLLAIAPTARQDGKADDTAPCGVWEVVIKFESACSDPLPVHAWVERNDTIIGARRPQRTRFVPDGPPGSFDGYVCDDVTFSSLANGLLTECVGAYEIGAFPNRADYNIRELRVTPYSGRGPVLHSLLGAPAKPSIYGPSDFSRTLPGIGVPGFFTGTRSRLSGTSAAAARVARWVAEGRKVSELNKNVQPADSDKSGRVMPGGVIPIDEIDDLA